MLVVDRRPHIAGNVYTEKIEGINVIGKEYTLESYIQHALEEKSNSKAASYVSIVLDGKTYWGTGIHTDIMTSSVYALVSAINRSLA